MDKQAKNIDLLEHIARYCEEISQTHTAFGDSFEKFKGNKDYFKSISMSLLQIGELANHLSKDFQKKYADLPYSAMISLRNIIVHGYGILETKKIWDTSHQDTPALQIRCLEILKEEENNNTSRKGQNN